MEQVPNDYKKAFNLGYQVAMELDLKGSMFSNEDHNENINPMQAGMNQFILERSNSKELDQQNTKTAQERVKGKNNGKGLTL